MKKLIIVGSGPAGVSASLYSQRAGVDTTIIGMGPGSLSKTDHIENYYGFEKPISGKDLHHTGVKQAKRLGVEILKEQVLSVNYNDGYEVVTDKNTYKCDSVLLSTGSSVKVPSISGIQKFEGRGVSYCAICDGFFHKGKDVVVLGSKIYAVHEAMELVDIARSVTILTNGEPMHADVPSRIKVDKRKIKNISGDQLLSSVNFEEGESMEVSGFFVALGSAGSIDFARKLGANIDNNKILVNEHMSTNVPGLFAAGDCTPGVAQIAKAVHEGSLAGLAAAKFIKEKNA